MNRTLSFFERQQGISNNFNYDFALTRLCVPKEDNWKGITPSTYSSDFNPEPPIFSAKFANCDNFNHILAIANEDGKIALHNTNIKNFDYEEKALEGQQCHFNAVFDLEWSPGQMKFVSASGDHTARLWDITESEIKQCRTFTGHTRSVKTATFRKNDPAVFSTGGRDGAILIWDTRAISNVDLAPRADNCIYSGHGPGTPVSQRKRTLRTPRLCPTATSSSITGLVFQNDNTLVSCGAGDGIIKVWDLRRNYSCYKREPLPKHSLPYAGLSTFKGFTNLLCDNSGNKLYANCMDNTIYCYNLSSYSTVPIERYVGFRNSTFYIKSCLSPDEKYLLSGSSDDKAYIWNVKNPQPLVTLNGHTVEVTCVAWSSANDMPVVTCSDDARHKIWKIGPEKIPDDEKINYRGNAVYCNEYKQKVLEIVGGEGGLNNPNILKKRLQALDRTPKSLRRIVEENEKTPSSVEKISQKRCFSEMVGEEYKNDHNCGSDQKRPYIETRGRRLFSPSTSASTERILHSSTVLEEITEKNSTVMNNREDSNQENSLLVQNQSQINNSSINSISSTKILSPLNERIDFNSKSPIASSSRAFTNSAIIFSPTSNLPNYVIDGDAPHLGIMSPKRKIQDKVDWLTKIRKQKLMSNRSSVFSEKLAMPSGTVTTNEITLQPSCDTVSNNSGLFQETNSIKNVSSPRSNKSSISKRRISCSSSNFSEIIEPHSKVSNSNRRNSETILKFFSTISSPSNSDSKSNVPSNLNLEKPTSSSKVVTTCE